jgi:hypothetical protein
MTGTFDDAQRLQYLAGVLAKMQRTGPCSRDFLRDCVEPITDQHISWAREVLTVLDSFTAASESASTGGAER